jgi:hypothetical protein
MGPGGIAAETPFGFCTDDECDVEFGGAKVPLQRLALQLPAGHGLSGVTFVVRSADGERWQGSSSAQRAAAAAHTAAHRGTRPPAPSPEPSRAGAAVLRASGAGGWEARPGAVG